ncbi:MAG: hypothetical protein M1497_00675 [Nitrospirae bacterium]|nr:hypothetical protein [Nitrospirota bacterium]
MTGNKAIRITSKLGSEFSTEVASGKEKYFVQTEDCGTKKHIVVSRVYLEGQILLTRKTDYADMADAPDRDAKVYELMRKQHQLAVNIVKGGTFKETKTTAEYLEEVKSLLKNQSKRRALRLLGDGLEQYPDDPFLLSYYGCLDAVANKNYRDGIDTCLVAIENLKKKVPFGEEFFFPVFYLNLGRAYLAAGKRKEAFKAFSSGLEMDGGNRDLLWEMRKLGLRKVLPVPFLKRSNPINKYIGMMLHALKK